MPTDPPGSDTLETPLPPNHPRCPPGWTPETCVAEIEKLRSDNGQLAHKLANAQRTVAELTENLEASIGRSNALVIDAEISSLLLEEIFNASHDAIWVLDRNFRIVRVNKRLANLVGCERQELVGRQCHEFLAFPLCGTTGCVLKRLLDKRAPSPVTADVEVALKGHETMSCILSATTCYDPCGEILGIIETFTDITARKQAESALQRVNEELAHLSRTDSLTSLANRRHFDEMLHIEWLRLRREKQFLSLLMIDVDFFKRYNDTYGHQAGDLCLASVAKAVRGQLKHPADLAARYGGEEFTAILPMTHPEGAHHLAELIRSEVECLHLPHATSSVTDHVTISIGVASFIPDNDNSPDKLIQRADQALYHAKEQGRNRTVLHAGPAQ